MVKKVITLMIVFFLVIIYSQITPAIQQTGKGDKQFTPISLEGYFNRDGISRADNPTDGSFDRRSAYPAEELPESGAVAIGNIPFLFPSKVNGKNNCVLPDYQQIDISPAQYSALYVLG
ncbi:MAG: hypothetical protein ACETWM_13995, partial [Candidatus Lokiarchaeia archaeon]